MNKSSGPSSIQFIIPLVMLLVLILGLSYMIPELTATQAFAIGGGVAVFIVCLASTEAALYILIFSMLLSPEFIVGTTEGASLGRGVTLRADDFLILLIGLTWIAKMAVNKELGLFLRTPLNKPIAYYIVICLISTLIGALFLKVDLKTGFFFVLKYFEYTLVYFMVVNHLKTMKQARTYLWALLITCAIVSVLGILQVPEGGRVSAPFEGEVGEPNTFGGYLVFMISITAGLLLTTTSFRLQMIYGFLTTLFIIPLLLTGSRSSYLGIIFVALAFLWLSEKRRVVLIGLVILGLLIPFVAPKTLTQRASFTFQQREQRGQIKVGGARIDTSTAARLQSWANISRDFVKHPVLGFGVTGYGFVDAQYFRVLIETGLIGLFIFLILLSSIFRLTHRIVKEVDEPFDKGLSMGFLAGFIGLLVHAVGSNTFIIVRIMEPFWFVLAMVVMLPDLETETPEASGAESIAHGKKRVR
ncbi:MAG: O-antigen ligase family protein [Deltaproteobacteria bacterium]|uniref:O-antigen ligase family protein n=1 Tax=Candidatus Desulfacyla euxinica TaxID=2841693 RepID=A0A8J6MZR0_9DELT|nr:O-antigen ligase family protein [Candidatus Desulfacyla euxinica]MBL7217728.1 O-antigen ligase family protein [Desulfobacteraceae bacterium]